MRRTDLEVTDPAQIDGIIQNCDCCRLGFSDHGKAYIVPLNFAFVSENGTRTFYFHGANEGRKLDLIRENGWAGFELDRNHSLHTSDIACNYAYRYECVIGGGEISILTDTTEKSAALQLIMEHYSQRNDWAFNEAALAKTAMLKLTVKEISCRVHQ
ncbi:MAG: pyridoxamine 5'-phosphate oxidase family protein [Evtepia sp.]